MAGKELKSRAGSSDNAMGLKMRLAVVIGICL